MRGEASYELSGHGLRIRYKNTLKTLTVLSSDPEANNRESGVKSTVLTHAECDRIMCWVFISELCVDQMRTVLSLDAEAIIAPDGL